MTNKERGGVVAAKSGASPSFGLHPCDYCGKGVTCVGYSGARRLYCHKTCANAAAYQRAKQRRKERNQ